MLFEGDLTSEKTEKLIENYAKLLNEGISSSEILVLVQNSAKKNEFIQKTLDKLEVDILEKMQVYSFFGLVYNTILDNRVYIENCIQDDTKTQIIPNLCGLELSQYIMRNAMNEVEFKGYNSRKSLLHQLFRRYSLIVQNDLTPEEVKWRSEDVLKESFSIDAKKALDIFLKNTLENRTFDYLRQSLIFNSIYKNTDYFKNIKYLILDDGDEVTPICYDFISYLKPQLKDFYIAYDYVGATRLGYLSANKNTNYIELFGQDAIKLKTRSKLIEDAGILYQNVTEEKRLTPKNIKKFSKLTRQQMLDMKDVKELLLQGIKPKEIVIITPIIDNTLRFSVKEILGSLCNPMFLSGSEKLIKNKYSSVSLIILKLAKSPEKVDSFELRRLFKYLDIPIKYCGCILDTFDKENKIEKIDLEVEEYTEKYCKFVDLLEKIKETSLLSKRVFEIYNRIFKKDPPNRDLIKFNFFIKQIEDFEKANICEEDILIQLENSIISENPATILDIKEKDLVIATPQKVIDNKIRSDYQFWFDISSDEWIKSDTGPLYNAWVMQKCWNKEEFTAQDNLELGKEKLARILRKLTLCAKKSIFTYSSFYDGNGAENYGGIEKFLTVEEVLSPKEKRKFVPREDQKPVLKYKEGKMAISAVPGAGKTTILLELIIKLLDSGVKPEKIYVMTYMESAARNFRERIKAANPDMNVLPNISTIHGLALRILKENNNCEKIGLASDFEICDDSKRLSILSDLSTRLKLTKKDSEIFEKAVSIIKFSKVEHFKSVEDKKLEKFILFYNEYDRILKENGLIDYDDMLLSSVKLLKENKDVLKYYRENCEILIEDEAQDSSSIQQELIGLLSRGNLIRCGDINQAITATFSNADVEGFRKFITETKNNVSIDCSQRCCESVWKLANSLVKNAENKEFSKGAFYKIFMKPTESNPVEKNALMTFVAEDDFKERSFVLKKIKDVLAKNPKSTIGVLLRNNFQVKTWTGVIENSGLKTVTRTECLEQKPFFRTIFAIMNIILNPFDNENVAQNYNILAENGLYKSGFYEKIKNCEKPFIKTNIDNLAMSDLSDFLWDMLYWLDFPELEVDELALKIGAYYYSSQIDMSNIYLVSTFLKRFTSKNFNFVVKYLNELSKKSSVSGLKFFAEEEKSEKEILEGKVQVMTMHKSKGDEFDVVFLPEMTEASLPITIENIKLRKDAEFMEHVRMFSDNYKPKSEEEIKKMILDENLRLMYVAITRAKRKLYVSVSKNNKKKSEPNEIFQIMESLK